VRERSPRPGRRVRVHRRRHRWRQVQLRARRLARGRHVQPPQHRHRHPTHLWASSGTVRIENVTVKGKCGEEQSRWRVGAAPDAEVQIVNASTCPTAPSTAPTRQASTRAPTTRARSPFVTLTSPTSGTSPVYVPWTFYVEGATARSSSRTATSSITGMSALRLAPDNSEVRRCYFGVHREGRRQPRRLEPARHQDRRRRRRRPSSRTVTSSGTTGDDDDQLRRQGRGAALA